MSNIKISQLPQASPITGAEQVPVNQQGVTSRTTAQNIANLASVTVTAGIGLIANNTNPRNPIIAIGYIAQDVNNLSNNITADATSTTKYPSVNAIKTYADGLVVGLVDDRGNFTPSPTSPGAYPSTNGSGAGGAIMKGDIWFIDTIGYLGTTAVVVGSSVRALVNNPTTAADWDILDAGLGYIPENSLNKSDDGTFNSGTPSHTLFPTQYAVATYITANTSKTLDAVLAAGNTAVDKMIELTSTSAGYSELHPEHVYIEDITGDQELYASPTDFYMSDSLSFPSDSRYIEAFISGTNPYITVVSLGSNTSGTLQNDSLIFTDPIGTISIVPPASITGTQVLTMPNASGTIALTSSIVPSWNLTGNSGTNSGTNFIGTTDNQDLVFKTNGIDRLKILSTGDIRAINNAGASDTSIAAQGTFGLAMIGYESSTIGGYLKLINHSNVGIAEIRAMNLSAYRIFELPNKSGTFALLSDIATSGTLQAVTTAGNTTDQGMTVVNNSDPAQYVDIEDDHVTVHDTNGSYSYFSTTDMYVYDNLSQNFVETYADSADPYLIVANLVNDTQSELFSDKLIFTNTLAAKTGSLLPAPSLSFNRTYTLPDGSGVIPLRVNGISADSAGDITISVPTATLQVITSGANKDLINGVNLQGTGAGGGTFAGSNVNAFGTSAASNNTGTDVNALGLNAATNNVGTYINALGQEAAKGNTSNFINAFGYYAGRFNTGLNLNAIGRSAGESNTANDVNAIGGNAAYTNTGDIVNAFGWSAASNNTGNSLNAIGYQSAESNTGNTINALGTLSAYQNTGNNVNALGDNTANINTGSNVNALGNYSAYSNSGSEVNAMGFESAYANAGSSVNAMGNNAAQANTGDNVNALGANAASGNTGSDVNAFGLGAGTGNTLSGMTIFSNDSMPSYADYAAASAAITVMLGATAGCTYLYHDQATNSIGAVRL